jgi:hypothetical protein
MTKSDTLVLDTPTSEWIAAFNQARGWKSLRGTNSAKPDAKNLRVSPKHQLEEESASALDGYDKIKLDKLVVKQEAKLATLNDAIEAAPQDANIDALLKRRKKLLPRLEKNKTDLAIVKRVDARVAQLNAVEGHLGHDLGEVRSKIRELEPAAKGFDPNTLDQALLAQFRKQHVAVQGNIEKARAEVMKITTLDGSKTRSYAIINNTEYKILFGMLEQAILLLATGDVPAAIARVEETQIKMNAFRTARTGATAIAPPVSEHGDLDGPVNDIETQIAILDKKGFTEAANQYGFRLAALSHAIQQAVNANTPDLRKQYLPGLQSLGKETAEARDQALAVEQIKVDIHTDISSMRANKHIHRPNRSQRELEEFDRLAKGQALMSIVVSDAQDAAKIIRARLDRTKKQDLRQSKLKPADMQNELKNLDTKYRDFFEQNLRGEIFAQKDTKSGELKGIKKNRKLPRGALEEIDLQLLAAKQLVQSDSVDALRTADEYLSGVSNFIAAIEKDPNIYVKLEKEFTRVEKKIIKTKKKFPLYEPGRLLDLKAELDALRASHLTRPQEDVTRNTDDLRERVLAFRAEMAEAQIFKRALEKQANGVDTTIKSIGERLAKDHKGIVQFDGYYGPEVARMATVRDQIAERSAASLKQASVTLVDISGNLSWLLRLLKKEKSGKPLGNNERLHVDELVSAARSGQLDNDANAAKKKEFDTGIADLAKSIKSAKDMLKDVNADIGDVTALETERDGLKAETKNSGKYIDGLAKLQGLNSRITQIRDEAKAAKEILDPDLATATANCAQALLLFTEKLGTFVEDVIEPEGQTDSGTNQLDQPPFNGATIRGFFAQLKGSLEQVNISELRAQSARVADRNLQTDKRKIARKIALQELRKLMALFESFAPMQHFRTHPFANGDASTRLKSAHKTLPLLEKRLLTAIKD